MIPEKWVNIPINHKKKSAQSHDHIINPAWADYMEALCEKLTSAIVECASMDEFECPFCGETKDCNPTCPVLASEEYLKHLKENP